MRNNLLLKIETLKTPLFLLAFLALFYHSGNAQLSTNYLFSQTNGTYTPIVSPSIFYPTTFDDTITAAITIPSFKFNGTVCNRMFICSNGWVSFRPTGTVSQTTTPISDTYTSTGVVAPFGADLFHASYGTPSVSWAVVGTEIVVQWQDVARYRNGGTNEKFSLQARMDTVSGTIKFVYDAVTASSLPTAQPQVGLRGTSNSDYINRSLAAAGAWTSTTVGTSNSSTIFFDSASASVPTAGLTYIFTVPTCFPPTGVAATAITLTGATLNWTAPVSGTPAGYAYEVVTAGSGAFSTPVTANFVIGGATTTATVTGLTPATQYDVYVKTGCSLTNLSDTSVWSLVYSFATVCNPISALPWAEGFEGIPTIGASKYPVCWSYTNITSSNYSCSTTCNSNTAHTGTKFIGGSNSFNVWEYTPGFQLTANASYDYSFWYKTNGSTNGYVVISAVGTTASVTGMTTRLGAVNNAVSASGYTRLTYTFVAPTTDVYYFGLHDSSRNSNPNGIAFDDFSLQLTPSCTAPTALTSRNVTATGAVISWTASTSTPANGYIYEVVASGAGSSAVPVLSGTVAAGITIDTLTGLSANTTYDVYVRAVCSSTDTSAWSDPRTLTTPVSCVPVTALTLISTSTTGASFSWTASTSAPANGYVYKIVASGAGINGTAVASGSTAAGVVTATATGLTASTAYDVYVRAACSATDSSTWVGPRTLTTQCLAITALPWNEGFESLIPTGRNRFPSCWSTVNTDGSTAENPGSDSSNVIVTTHGGPHNGHKYLFTQYNNTSWIFTPGFQLTAGTSYDFGFFMEDASVEDPGDFIMNVAYGSSPSVAGMTTPLLADSLCTNSTYQPYTKTFIPATSGVYYFGVKSTSTDFAPWFLSFDDFSLALTPSCVVPTALTSSNVNGFGATISWTASTSAPTGGYNYEVVASGAGSSATPIVSGSTAAGIVTATVTGLTPTTTYDVYVQSNCGSGVSTWAGPISITTTVSCTRPTALTTSGVTTTGLTLSWTASTSAPTNGYIYKVVASGAGSGGTAVASGTTAAGVTTATISGLTANTPYDIYVRSVCSTTDSSAWAGPKAVSTTCVAITAIPWTENFDAMTSVGAGIYPSCWSTVNLVGTNPPGSDNGTRVTTHGGPHSGSNFLYSQYDNTAWVFTPGFQLTAGTYYDFSFFMENVNASDVGFSMDVAYGASADVTGMTNPLITGNQATNTSYQKFTSTFTPATSGIYYFGVKSTSTNTVPWYLSFDDFALDLTPACSTPTTVSASAPTSNGVAISWSSTPGGTTSGYSWEVVASGAGSTGTPVASGSTTAGVTTATVTGLTANTTYDVYVESNCSGATWGGPASFTTTCVATTLPLIEGFNSTSIPSCWSEQVLNGSLTLKYVASSSNPSTTPQEGSDYVWYNSFSFPNSTGFESRLVSPAINTTGTPSVDLSFYWFNDYNADYIDTTYATEGVTVEYSIDHGTTWVDYQFYPRTDVSITMDSGWFKKRLTLPAAAGNQTGLLVGFKFHSQFGDNLSFDNLNIFATPACAGSPDQLAVSNVTTTSAVGTWTDATPLPASGYNYILVASGTGYGSTPIVSGASTNDTAIFSGLTPNTSYDMYVQTNCGGTGVGAWEGPVTFTTLCVNSTLPLIQGFNDSIIPSCWSQQYVVGTDDLTYIDASSNPTTTPQEGSHFVFWDSYGYDDGDETRLVSPAITTTGTASVVASFYFFNENNPDYATFTDEGMVVQYSTDGVNWTDVQSYSRHDGSLALHTGRWQKKYLTLPAGAGNQPNLYVGFKFHSQFGDNVSFDNLNIFPSSPCTAGPTSITVTPTSTTTASLGWTASTPAPANGYNWIVVAAGDSTNGTIIASGSTAAGITTASVTGLTANTPYDVYVQNNCGGGLGTGYWFGPQAFSTPCSTITSIPWTEGFEGMPTVGTDFVPSCWLPTPLGRWNSFDQPLIFPPLVARNGTHYLFNSFDANDTIYTPSFALTGGTQYEFYFYYQTDGSTGWDTIATLMGSSQSPAGMTQVIGTPVLGATNTGYVKYSAIFTPATSGDYVFGVQLVADGGPNNIAFDDFGLQVVIPCPNPPVTGIISGPSGVCPGNQAALTLTGYSPFTTQQWQASVDSIAWFDLIGATGDNIVDFPTTLTYYRVKVKCADSSYSPVFVVNMNPQSLCYCTSGLVGACGTDDIDTVAILATNFFVNYTACNTTANGDAYTAFPIAGDSTTTLQRGGAYTLKLHMTNAALTSAWIDYNHNGTFDSIEWVRITTATSSGTAILNVPANAGLGLTGFRVRSRDTGTTNGADDACSDFGSGETFDFIINITDTICTNHAPTVVDTVSNVTCNGSANGSISLSASGSMAPYAHSWSTGATTTSITGLAGGTYTDTISYSPACTYLVTRIVSEPRVLAAIDSISPVKCFGGSTGQIAVHISGGTAPYTHHWSNGTTASPLTGVAVGVYTDTITDSHGCRVIGTRDTVTQPTVALAVRLDSTHAVKCNGGSNGTIYITATGGTAPYIYAWTDPAHTTTDDVTGLSQGTYSVVVTDANQCTATKTDSISQPTVLAVRTDSVVDTKCHTSSDGSIYITASGGTIPYAYAWTGGNTSSLLFNKPAGAYTLTVTDHNGCTTTVTDTITSPSAISITSNISNQVQNGSQGSITLSVSGGTTPYRYQWNPNIDSTSSLTNLIAGVYKVTVTDKNGCTATQNDTVQLILGIDEKSGDITNFNIYPNPSSGIFNIVLQLSHVVPMTMEVTSITGQVISISPKENAAGNSYLLDMSSEADGVYFVKVTAGDNTLIRRITVVR